MGKTAILAIRIIGDASHAIGSMNELDGHTRTMQDTMNRASIGAGIALGGLAAAAIAVGNAASEAQQATGAVDAVFGSYAGKVHEYASNAVDGVALAKSEYQQMAAVLGSQLKNMGVEMHAVAGKSNDLIVLGADLAATFGTTTADAVGALSSLLRGERDPIERFGVTINQVKINAKLAEMGLSGLTGEAARAAETQATLALLMEQTAAVQGQFAREGGSAAQEQEKANAAWKTALATLGEQLLPIMAEGARRLGALAKWVGNNKELVTGMALAIGVLAAGILILNGVTKAYAAVQTIATAATLASNAAWLTNPITWIVLGIVVAIGLMVAIIVMVIQHWDKLATATQAVGDAIGRWVQDACNWLGGALFDAIKGVIGFFNNLGNAISDAFRTAVGWLRDAYDWLTKLVGNAVPGWVKNLFGTHTFTASMAINEPPFSSSFLTFSADEAISGFGFNMVPKLTFAAPAQVPSLGHGSLPHSGSDRTVIHNEYNITIQGAIDVDGTARAIKDVMQRHGTRTGTLEAAGKKWQ